MKTAITLFGILLITANSALAINSQKCSNLLNNGLWKTYKYGGIGEAYWNAVTDGTKKEGSTKASSESSTTEPTTALTDPKYTSNISTSNTQSTSSWGECSMFALREELKKARKRYIAQNIDELKIEMAKGEGEHLKVVTFYSMCEKSAYSPISRHLQGNVSKFIELNPKAASENISKSIDGYAKSAQGSGLKCYTI